MVLVQDFPRPSTKRLVGLACYCVGVHCFGKEVESFVAGESGREQHHFGLAQSFPRQFCATILLLMMAESIELFSGVGFVLRDYEHVSVWLYSCASFDGSCSTFSGV